jgi:hypothetical protein
VYIICYTAPTVLFQIFFAFLGCTAEKLCIIHGQILCRVVKCGLDILEVLKNPYDFPQPVIISTHPVGQILIIFSVVLNKEICEWLESKWKEEVMACFKVLAKCLPGTAKDHNRNSQSRYLSPDFNLKPPKYKGGLLTSVPQS